MKPAEYVCPGCILCQADRHWAEKETAAFWVDLPVEQWIYYSFDETHTCPHNVIVGDYVRARFETKAAAEAVIKKLHAVVLSIPIRIKA